MKWHNNYSSWSSSTDSGLMNVRTYIMKIKRSSKQQLQSKTGNSRNTPAKRVSFERTNELHLNWLLCIPFVTNNSHTLSRISLSCMVHAESAWSTFMMGRQHVILESRAKKKAKQEYWIKIVSWYLKLNFILIIIIIFIFIVIHERVLIPRIYSLSASFMLLFDLHTLSCFNRSAECDHI